VPQAANLFRACRVSSSFTNRTLGLCDRRYLHIALGCCSAHSNHYSVRSAQAPCCCYRCGRCPAQPCRLAVHICAVRCCTAKGTQITLESTQLHSRCCRGFTTDRNRVQLQSPCWSTKQAAHQDSAGSPFDELGTVPERLRCPLPSSFCEMGTSHAVTCCAGSGRWRTAGACSITGQQACAAACVIQVLLDSATLRYAGAILDGHDLASVGSTWSHAPVHCQKPWVQRLIWHNHIREGLHYG
jgi:hypothetical protein